MHTAYLRKCNQLHQSNCVTDSSVRDTVSLRMLKAKGVVDNLKMLMTVLIIVLKLPDTKIQKTSSILNDSNQLGLQAKLKK